jgi:hypothetical protein
MLSTNLISLICLSLLATSSVAHPPPPPGHLPISFGTHISSGAPHFPTGTVPTAFIPHGTGTATIGHPHIPLPTFDDASEESKHEKRFEGPRHQRHPIAWHRHNPNAVRPSNGTGSPPLATAGPWPSGTQGFPTAGPTASRPSARPTAF